ncbi:MAG TPA: P-loop NTPase [Acidothermaceae bacterium]|jgi:capsular exopolysaccharide synthesis family protein
MDARRFWHAVAHRWVVLLLLLILGPVVGAVVALELPVHYRATTAVLISSDHIGSIDDLGAGSQLAVNAAPSFAALVTSPAVLSPAITTLGLNSSPDQLAPDIRVTVALASSTVTISVTSTGRAGAAALANAVADQFALLVPKLSPTIETAPAFEATKIEAAYPPASDTGLRVVGGIGIGLFAALALCWAIVAAYASNPLIDRREVAVRATAVPVVGTIPPAGRKASGSADPEPDSAHAVVTTVAAVAPRVQCLMVVSPRSGDGRTRTAVNMAMGAAQSSRSVLLVDADLSEPDVARLLDLAESAGLKGILAGTASFADVVQPVGSDGLHVITAGSTGAGGTPHGMGHPLLASIAMARFLANARERYDLVVIDTPPMFLSSDSLTLAAQVDGIVVVVDARRTRQRMLTASLRRLTIAGGSVVGIVLNRAVPPVLHRHFGADSELNRLAGV